MIEMRVDRPCRRAANILQAVASMARTQQTIDIANIKFAVKTVPRTAMR